jgi:NAD(P)H-hydrate epimerase
MALSAFKMGVGYVNIIVPDSLFNAYVGKVPECILTSNKDMNGQMRLDIEVLDKILHYDAIAVGMGMGCSQGTYDIVSYLLKNYKGKLIIDADGLNALSQFGLDVLNDKTCEVVLTPHLGEFSRLSRHNIDEIKQKTVEYVSDFARHNKVTLLLKNAVSVVCGNEEIFLNTKGSVGMAKAGSGDVLSGIITGLITANKEEPICKTVAAACYVFGLSGEIVERKQNVFTMTASDLIAALPETINSIMS